MATLQKFKLLATQCATTRSPTQSPTTSPVFQLRRRKTLRMFLTRSGSSNRRRGGEMLDRNKENSSSEKKSIISNKLRDLFLSSSPDNNGVITEISEDDREVLMERVRRSIGRRNNGRNLSAAIRCRLMRRPWRPVLFTIPE
ncbi:hypothetical protein ACHQM5_009515 [Ranunculus cassubicifolius]